MPEQRLEPPPPRHDVGVEERDEVGFAGGQAGVARRRGSLAAGCRSTCTSQCMSPKSLCCTGGDEPSSTTTTRMPRSVDQPPETKSVVEHRNNDRDVAVRRAGSPAGWATVASSRVRASCALTASCTSSRPLLSIVCAAARGAAAGWVTRRAAPIPLRALSPGDPPGRRTRRAVAVRSCQHPVTVRGPRRDAPQQASTISAKIRTPRRLTPSWGLRAPRPADRGDAALAQLRHQLRQRRSVAGDPLVEPTLSAKYVAIQTFRCGRHARRRPRRCTSTSPTSRPS